MREIKSYEMKRKQKSINLIPVIEVFTFSNTNDIPKPDTLDKTKKNLIIFDDCAFNPNQTNLKLFYTKGRHNTCNSIYLTQDYYQLDKKSIRNNSNFQIFFKLNPRDISSLHTSITSLDIPDNNKFKLMCNKAWETRYNFISINKDETDLSKKYLINFKDSLDINIGMGLSKYSNEQVNQFTKTENSLQNKISNNKNMRYMNYLQKEEEQKPILKN